MTDYDNPLSDDNPGDAGNDDATVVSGMNAAGFEPPTPEEPAAVEQLAAEIPQTSGPAEPTTSEPPAYEPYSPPAPSTGGAVAGAPPQKDNKKSMIIIVVIVLLLLCCCCLAVIIIGWNWGDQIMESLNLANIVRGLMPV